MDREQAAQERMAFLRANDVEAYLQLAQSAKNSRLNELLSSTDACLRQLTARLSQASSVLIKGPRCSGGHWADEQGKQGIVRWFAQLQRLTGHESSRSNGMVIYM